MLPVEANLKDKPSEFALICPLLSSGYQLYYCIRRQYTTRMNTWYMLIWVPFCSTLTLTCAPQRCGQTVRVRVRASAQTCVPSNKCGRFREPDPKQRDLTLSYARCVKERLAKGISVQIGCCRALNEHCTLSATVILGITSTSSLDARLQ